MTETPEPQVRPFTPQAFAWTVIKVMLVCAIIAAILFVIVTATTPEGFAFSALAPFAYLIYLLAWAVAYTQFFKFPEKQVVLVLGVVTGAILLTVGAPLTQADPAAYGGRPMGVGGALIGCAFQLYALVIALRFFPFLRPRI